MKHLLLLVLLTISIHWVYSQQKTIPRIEQMPNFPPAYSMRNWKQVAIDYDHFVFDANKTGTHLPLINISSNAGTNYPAIYPIRLDTYVGQNNHGRVAEAISILPAVIGASLLGVDKTNHWNTNWVVKLKDFFNLKNGQNVYLNNYSASTGGDWWYETMPNVFFYQLISLYPNADPDFNQQFRTVADRQLDVVYQLGGSVNPWQTPNMNYRAFNLLTGKPNATGVPEPEAAGSIAWILYQAYLETQELKYKQGADLALSFLHEWTKNPSYEIQLPYGIVTAARMNALENTQFNIDKMLNWTFSPGTNTLRGWGCIVGNWNGYEMSGLIGEANDKGNDYAFSMNGFQHAAALAPVAKYDKRYARAIAKWMLNLANSCRYFYSNALPEANQEAQSYAWSKIYDPQSCIPYESIKENWGGTKPCAMGDAVKGNWAATNLSLYSGSSVGYLAALIDTTNVTGILQIDLNRTDFRNEEQYPTFLYYNPHTTTQNVRLKLPDGNYDIYDTLSETTLKTNVSGETTFDIASDKACLLVIYPSGSLLETTGKFRKVKDGYIIDYHYSYDFGNGLNNILSERALVYPNPFHDGFKIQLPLGESANKIEITDLSGKTVVSEKECKSADYGKHLSAGIYIIKITTASKTYLSKLIKNY